MNSNPSSKARQKEPLNIHPKDEAEFIRFMEDIDNELKSRGVPIAGRPLQAIREACIKLKTPLNVAPLGPLLPGVYSGDSLSRRIEAWYEERYGDRLKINWSPGSVAILIRGDPWRIKLPRLYGRFKFVFDPCLEKYYNSVPDSETINPLQCIEGLKTEFAQGLTKGELQEIASFFVSALRSTERLSELGDQLLLPEARADQEMAVSCLFLPHPNYGQSKWATLQFTEKLLKSYLAFEQIPYPTKGHHLADLAKLTADKGLQVISRDTIAKIQCPAGVRYGEIPVSLPEAINAHYASLEVCFIACSTIRALSPFSSVAPDATVEPIQGLTEGLFYVLPARNYYFYCNKIEGNSVNWVLIESYQNGSLFQAGFVQGIEHASDYVPVTRLRKMRSLEEMLRKLKQIPQWAAVLPK